MQNAVENMYALRDNPYPGRGIIVGLTSRGALVQVAWMMGRGDDSRNRRYAHEGAIVRTVEADPSRPLKNPELTLYNAMREGDGVYVVSNGRQTDDAHEAFARGGSSLESSSLFDAMMEWEFEPDPPNYTPRITAACRLQPFAAEMVAHVRVLDQYKHPGCNQVHTALSEEMLRPGFGYCLHTYKGDGNPLPSTDGKPILVPVIGSIVGMAEYYWNALNADNRVAIAAKFIDAVSGVSEVHIINKY